MSNYPICNHCKTNETQTFNCKDCKELFTAARNLQRIARINSGFNTVRA